MLEGLAKQRDKEIRNLNVAIAVQGLGLYGIATLMQQLQVPEPMTASSVLAIGAVVVYRWLHRRWAAESVVAAE